MHTESATGRKYIGMYFISYDPEIQNWHVKIAFTVSSHLIGVDEMVGPPTRSPFNAPGRIGKKYGYDDLMEWDDYLQICRTSDSMDYRNAAFLYARVTLNRTNRYP